MKVIYSVPLFKITSSAQNFVHDDLFSGMIHGIRVILNESIQHGNIQEMKLEKAILLLEYDQKSPIVVVLLATHTSKSLRQALNLFTKQFQILFLKKDVDYSEISQFDPASKLISEYFDFLPYTMISKNK